MEERTTAKQLSVRNLGFAMGTLFALRKKQNDQLWFYQRIRHWF
jgi:hypothetical protein